MAMPIVVLTVGDVEEEEVEVTGLSGPADSEEVVVNVVDSGETGLGSSTTTVEMANLRTKNITYDDRDMVTLKYQGTWFHDGTWNASSVGQTGTLTSSNDPKATVTFNFPVPAIAFHYFGMLRSNGGLYGICIDCDPNGLNFQTIDAFNTTDDGKNPPVLLFSERFDTPAQHVVILKNKRDQRGVPKGNSQITIDRFVLEVVDNSSIPITSPPSPSPSPTRDSGGAGLSVGAIVGGALGGILFVVIVIVTGLYYWHRKQRGPVDDPDPPTRHHYPYPSIIYGHSRGDTNTSFTLSTLSPSTFSSSPSTNFSLGTGSSSRTRSSRRTRSTQSSSERRSRRGRRYEVDAGPVIVEGEDEDDEALLPQHASASRGNGTRRTSSTPGALESIPEHEGAQQPSTSSESLPPSLVPSRFQT
ncbi:hypothetical protein PQX77_010981 [Marasmius sp. AFHP31]|nr:hypothetical protein PQX77_010981 [Marasmius sp. AFHP31]